MNIVLLTSGALRNAKESAYLTTISYAQELQKQGQRVFVVTERRKGMNREETMAGINFIHPYNLGVLNKLLAHPLAIRYLQKKHQLKINLIHGFSASPWFALNTWLAGLLVWRAKKIHTLRSYPRQRGKLRGAILLNLLDKVTVPTAVFAQRLWSVRSTKVKVVHSPIDLQKFFPRTPHDKAALKEQYGYAGKKVVLYYGALTENKGISVLFQAIERMVWPRRGQPLQDVLFLILPRHTGIEKWTNLIESSGINPYVKIITTNLPIEDYVNLADVVALPYLNLWGTDGNPSCLLEALACGTPVVTTDFPELKEIAEGAAEFTKAGNTTALVEKLQQVLNHPDQKKIKKGLEIVPKFAPEAVAARMNEVYSEVAAVLHHQNTVIPKDI